MNFPEKIIGDLLIQYLKDEKADLEKRGLIATLDEAIIDAEHYFYPTPEDFAPKEEVKVQNPEEPADEDENKE